MSTGDPPKLNPADLVMRVSGGASFTQLQPPVWLDFQCGLRINMQTGEVVIPPWLTLDDASREFWTGLGRFIPVERKPP